MAGGLCKPDCTLSSPPATHATITNPRYPNRDEVLQTDSWVLPVEMKQPGVSRTSHAHHPHAHAHTHAQPCTLGSITLSLPVMKAAKEVVIAACGVSEKYPQGKSAGMLRAIHGAETLQSFPASGLRKAAVWIIDEAAGSKLPAEYLRKP